MSISKTKELTDLSQRLLHLLNTQKISGYNLEKYAGINHTSISHIKNGRNQPSRELLDKIINYIPELNKNWLLTGEGEMLKTDTTASIAVSGGDNTGHIGQNSSGDIIPAKSYEILQIEVSNLREKLELKDELIASLRERIQDLKEKKD